MAFAQANPAGLERAPLEKAREATPGVIIFLFMASLLLPIVIHAGPLAMSPSRLFCLIAFFPCLFLWLTGRAGPIRTFDILFISATLWAAFTYLVNHGLANGYERAGFVVVEWMGGYLFGRTAIRCAQDFRLYLRLGVLLLIVMLPFAIVETQTGTPVINEFLSRFVETVREMDNDPRLGLHRAQVVFPHPILYGIFCAAMLAPVVRGLGYASNASRQVSRIGIILASTICSVSSGAWLLFLVQSAFLIYDRIMRRISSRWILLFAAGLLLYLLIEVAANSSPVKVFVRYFTLNSASGHYRIAQFDAAIQNVFNNPVFGIGAAEFVRPPWMTASIDNFWMVLSVRHGAILFFLFLGSILFHMFRLARIRPADEEVRGMQVGYLIALGSFLMAVVTVHVWSNLNVWFMFFLGAGVWFLDVAQDGAKELAPDSTPGRARGSPAKSTPEATVTPEADADPALKTSRYSRFPTRKTPQAPTRVGTKRKQP